MYLITYFNMYLKQLPGWYYRVVPLCMTRFGSAGCDFRYAHHSAQSYVGLIIINGTPSGRQAWMSGHHG
jgi:hypothetical protein